MIRFSKGKFDDQCDSTSQALDWIKTGYNYDGSIRWLELSASKSKRTTPDTQPEACPHCHSNSLSYIGPEIRCLDCGHQWGRMTETFLLPTRTKILKGW
jgi:DNA-directed RNA polymerase subunit M/transcription elongation factor TFIIS